MKLDLYRRLARAVSSGEIDELRDELRERFGPLPDEAETLLDMARLRVLGAELGLQHVLVRGDEARLTFRPGTQPGWPASPPPSTTCSSPPTCGGPCPCRSGCLRLGGEPIIPALVRALHQAMGAPAERRTATRGSGAPDR